jgi:hypothetical protein
MSIFAVEIEVGASANNFRFNGILEMATEHCKQIASRFDVADMIRSGFSREAILREIAKCVVLCLNCHQIEHYEERK